MAASTYLGDGTLTVGTTPTDFSCEVLGLRITHTYEETTAKRRALCGTEKPATRKRTDGVTASIENDLSAAGLYQFLQTNDLTTQALVFTPNTDDGAKWEGEVQVTLPSDIGADEYGQPLASAVEWEGVGTFTFTPATVTP